MQVGTKKTHSAEKDTVVMKSKKYSKTGYATPIDATLEVIGGKYKVAILYHLRNGVLRFGELRRLMPSATQRMVTNQLRELERNKLIAREVFKQVPPRVEYSMTESGFSLLPILEAMCAWGKRRIAMEKD